MSDQLVLEGEFRYRPFYTANGNSEGDFQNSVVTVYLPEFVRIYTDDGWHEEDAIERIVRFMSLFQNHNFRITVQPITKEQG